MLAKILPDLDFLRLYRAEGLWCFDRHDLGLERELFVGGMTELIDAVIAEKPFPVPNPVLLFGGEFNPSTRLTLIWKESRAQEDGEWNRYHCREMDKDGWLGPCLLRFFPEAPQYLHFEIYDAEDPFSVRLVQWLSNKEIGSLAAAALNQK
ncbi:MAG TPA: hypothetical protein VIM61_01405 [Chthoniobacterales bacterium]